MEKFIKAVFNAKTMKLTAFTNEHRCEDFDVYTQKEYDEVCTLKTLTERLKESDELPDCYDSYEEYAEAMWDSVDEILFDRSYSDQWEELCKKAGIKVKDYPIASWAASYPESMFEP